MSYIHISIAALPLPSVTLLSTYHDEGVLHNTTFGMNNEILSGHEESNTFTKYTFRNTEYTKIWSKPPPEGFDITCEKFISPSGQIILHSGKRKGQRTDIYSSDLALLISLRGTPTEILAVSDNRLVYKNRHDRKNVIDIYDYNHQHIHTAAFCGQYKYKMLSACITSIADDDDMLVVVDKKKDQLDLTRFRPGEHFIFRAHEKLMKTYMFISVFFYSTSG